MPLSRGEYKRAFKDYFENSSWKKASIRRTMPVPKTVIFIVLCVLSFFTLSTGYNLTPSLHSCSNSSTFAPNSTYQSNLHLLLSSLSSKVKAPNAKTWFFNTSSVGETNRDGLYGSFLCKGDIPRSECEECVKNVSVDITHICPMAKQAIVWFDQCMLRYSDTSYFSTLELRPLLDGYNGQSVENDPGTFMAFVNKTMSHLVDQAARNPLKVYCHQENKFSAGTEIYEFVQCVPDISAVNCSTCLRTAAANLKPGKIGGRVMLPSCFVRFEQYPFYQMSSIGKSRFQAKMVIAITAATSSSALLFVVILWFMLRKRRRSKPENSAEEDQEAKQIPELHSLQFQLHTIEAATNNFSDDNKLGEGGFGPVFKGTLPGGEEIAAKMLSRNSGQGVEEFRNEVELVAKLQHRNLVRLLGFSMEKQETVLVYEYVSHGSLDRWLYDPERSQLLDWSARYKIIVGVARGLLYLHEDSRLRIIHRDLKASNILLDGDMNPKISDFGMARIFCSDQMPASTNRIVGTYGYMSPEYMMFGQFSVKSDVYSFGVLMLEVITGKKNSQFVTRDCYEGLLGYVWNRWSSGMPLEVVDPTLGKSYSPNEVIRCIQIGLLCVQDDVEDRPTMDSVVLMLNTDSICIPVPQEPSFVYPSKKYKEAPSLLNSILDQSTSKGDQSNSKITSPFSGTEGCHTDPGPR